MQTCRPLRRHRLRRARLTRLAHRAQQAQQMPRARRLRQGRRLPPGHLLRPAVPIPSDRRTGSRKAGRCKPCAVPERTSFSSCLLFRPSFPVHDHEVRGVAFDRRVGSTLARPGTEAAAGTGFRPLEAVFCSPLAQETTPPGPAAACLRESRTFRKRSGNRETAHRDPAWMPGPLSAPIRHPRIRPDFPAA